MNKVYMDNAATTRISQPVLEAMLPYLSEAYGNPSSIHWFGREAKKAVEAAREQVADALNAKPGEIYFTASGTESDNWAIRGAAYARKAKGRHIITSAIEHHAVLHTCMQLEKEGFTVTYLPVDAEGLIDPAALENELREDTILVTIMAANSEIGVIQPIVELAAIAKAKGVWFHTDAVQLIGAQAVDVREWGIDMLSLSGHKFHGPKGVGALYIRSGVKIGRFVEGGAQERSQRAGTENLAGIVGLGKAIALARADVEARADALTKMRDHLIRRILSEIPDTRLNGHATKRLPGNVNVSFHYIEGEALLLSLDLKGIAGSSGSACTSGSLDPSHVLLAIGLPHEIAHGSLRLTLSEENTMAECDYVVESLKEVVQKLRDMSPMYADAMSK
ncbi:MAG: cysteine desulfurase NifS [Christensenellales bacterium]|jgi:cysteine desulfurase